MKIVYCIFATRTTGGVERILTDKANYLASQGLDVTIITTDQREGTPFFPLDPRIKMIDLGINYDQVSYLPRLKKYYKVYQRKQIHRKRLTKVLHELKADIVISTGFHEVSFLPSIADGSKKIYEYHNSKLGKILQNPNDKLIWRLVGWYRTRRLEQIARSYDKFVILTKEDKTYWQGDNILVIPNFCAINLQDVENIDISRNTAKKIIALGRFDHQKKFVELIEIFGQIPLNDPRFSGWKLEIVGDGYLKGHMERKIEELGLQESVTLNPFTLDVVGKLASASIFAFPSKYEGFGLVLLESMIVGLPAVSYACPCGPRDLIVDRESGFLVEPGDKHTFAERLKQLMEDADLRKRMGEVAREQAKRFTKEAIMQQWLNLFTEITNTK